MKRIFVSSLPSSTTEEALLELFSQFGKVHSLTLLKDMFTGRCKGTGILEMEGHNARAAIDGLDGKTYEGNSLKVRFEQARGKGQKGWRR